jgi:hypothetical protein
MEVVMNIYNAIVGPTGLIIFMVLFGVSEVLAQIPAVQANSVYQAIMNALKFIKEKVYKK